MKPGGGKAKGSEFERGMCKLLSLWWTGQERNDVFVRSVMSGGWQTTRAKSNQSTYGQAGDICVNDPIGSPLLDAYSFELKCGYGSWTFMEVIEGKKGQAAKQVEKFIEQAEKSTEECRSQYPALILKRDRKQPVIMMPLEAIRDMRKVVGAFDFQYMQASFKSSSYVYYIINLNDWLEWATPEAVRFIYEKQ